MIYKARIEFDIYVEAKNAIEATQIASYNAKEELGNILDGGIVSVDIVNDIKSVQDEWKHSIPYGHKGNKNLFEILTGK